MGGFIISGNSENQFLKKELWSSQGDRTEVTFVADHCPDVLWSYNLEKNCWNYISPSILYLTGYNVEEAMATSLEGALTLASYQFFLEETEKRLQLFLSDESIPHMNSDEIEIVTKDGSVVLCDITTQCIRNGAGELTLTGVTRAVKGRAQAEKELRASEKRYREILEAIEEGYYETDLKGNLVFFNDAACRMYGYSSEEFFGISYRKLYKDPESVFHKFNQVYLTEQPDSGFTMEIVRKDGSTAYVEISILPLRNEERKICGFRGIARDITERIMFQQQLEYFSMHDQLTGLYNRTYFEEEVRRLSKSRDYPITLISFDLNGLKLINDSMGHDQGDRLLTAAAEVLQETLRGSDVLARVGGDEFTAILPNCDEQTAEKVIERIRKNVQAFCDDNPDLYLSLSIGAATAEDNSVTFKDLFKQADDAMYRDKFAPSSSARNKIIKSLMDALAEKDYIADGHARRLAIMCRKIGNKMGLSRRQQADLALLAQVHDLGKVGIPDKILLKKEPLNENEWRIIKQHPEKGHRIALSSNYLTGIANLILKHHEYWDGTGYPLGLRGREIPVECRILTVVDAFDAMTNARPYRKVKTGQKALAELQRCAGSQFDPDVVKTFEEEINPI